MTLLSLTRRLVSVLFALLALPVSAQDILGVEGTWEMTEADAVPNDDLLVFSRMTFTGDRLRVTSVYLDPDDGGLTARNTNDRYIESAGQIVVRALGSAAVLDVGRTLDGLVVRDLETGVTLRLREADPDGAFDPALVGSWAGASESHQWTFRFDADGKAAATRDGERHDRDEDYLVAGAYLLIDEDAYHFFVTRDRLMLARDGETIDLTRAEARAAAPATLAD